MKLLQSLTLGAAALLALGATGCNDSKTYAELLDEEASYINSYLANQKVSYEQPVDSNFKYQVGPDAPYYRLDEDGNLYMQVLNPGTPGNMAKYDDLIYFRFTRYDLRYYLPESKKFTMQYGNETDMGIVNPSFRFQNFMLEDTSKWGIGIQYPLTLLPVDAEVNLIVKSAWGFTQEEADVVPYVYHMRYYRPKI